VDGLKEGVDLGQSFQNLAPFQEEGNRSDKGPEVIPGFQRGPHFGPLDSALHSIGGPAPLRLLGSFAKKLAVDVVHEGHVQMPSLFLEVLQSLLVDKLGRAKVVEDLRRPLASPKHLP